VGCGGGLVLAPFYLAGALRLVTTVRGDADGDGRVSFADYQRLERGYGKPGGWQDGDFNLFRLFLKDLEGLGDGLVVASGGMLKILHGYFPFLVFLVGC
jgi:hypothetical protein